MATITFKNPWLRRHVADPYVKRAQQQHFRSRAAYKLLAVQQKDHILKPKSTVIDLGASPGAWSQIARQHIGPTGKIIAIDKLPMQPIEGVFFVQGDLTAQNTQDALHTLLGTKKADVVLSDLAPNLSGLSSIDQPRSYDLLKLALSLLTILLKTNGVFLVKCFHGKGFDDYFKELRAHFKQVLTRKPDASRNHSREIYLLAKGYRT